MPVFPRACLASALLSPSTDVEAAAGEQTLEQTDDQQEEHKESIHVG